MRRTIRRLNEHDGSLPISRLGQLPDSKVHPTMSTASLKQLPLFELHDDPSTNDTEESRETNRKAARTGTFIDNMKLPVHGWFRYSAGFSAQWVESVIDSLHPQLGVLDPFCGSGTTLLAAESKRVRSIGFEPHPFVFRAAQAKLSWNTDTRQLLAAGDRLLDAAARLTVSSNNDPLLSKCYDPTTLGRLDALRVAYAHRDSQSQEHGKIDQLLFLCITSILRECSTAGTATWQYVLPRHTKKKTREPFDAFRNRLRRMASDIQHCKTSEYSDDARILLTDARNHPGYPDRLFDLVVTSPPYPNNYDYADATRLEMTFWRELQSWGELHGAVRKYLMRSCSQHTAIDKLILSEILMSRELDPIRDEITPVCSELETIRLERGGKKTYHRMIAAYFVDLAQVFRTLRRLCSDNSNLCFVVGDSAPYGVYVPTEKWLGTLALAAGFKSFRFDQIRERNTKWKNRKHRVPLKEGHLWISG